MNHSENNYYVYKVVLGTDILYIGFGSGDRYKHGLSGCSHVYELNKLHFEGADVRVKKVHENLSKSEARRIEHTMIKSLSPKYNIMGNKPVLIAKSVSNMVNVISKDMCNNKMAVEIYTFMCENMKWWLKGMYVNISRSSNPIFSQAISTPAKYILDFKFKYPHALSTERVTRGIIKIKFSEEYLADVKNRSKKKKE